MIQMRYFGLTLFVGIILLGRIPVWSDKLTRKQRAFDYVMSHARPASRRTGAKKPEFLYLLWFDKGSLFQGQKYSIDTAGDEYSWQLLYDYSERGGNLAEFDPAQKKELLKVSRLPIGLPNRHSVSFERLLVVGLRQGQTWQTYYYDRQNLPVEVRKITQLIQNPYRPFWL